MITFVQRRRVRVRVLAVGAIAIAAGAWWRAGASAHLEPASILIDAQGIPSAPDDRDRGGPCLAPAPRGGIYAIDDGSIRVAVVDGCVAAEVRPRLLWDDRAPQEQATLVAPQLHLLHDADDASDARDEVVLVPSMSHIATARDGMVLAVADGTLTVFTRFGDGSRTAHSQRRVLALIAALDDRDPRAILDLLQSPDPMVQAAVLTRLARAPLDDKACTAVSGWIQGAHDDHRHGAITLEIGAATDRCLVPAIRNAIDDPALAAVAAGALARIGTPDEKAEATLAILDAPNNAGAAYAIHGLAQYLHPEHCGTPDPNFCLTAVAAADFERALRDRLDLDKLDPVLLTALQTYLGPERYAASALDLAATGPCPAIEPLVAPITGGAVAADRIAPAFAPILDRPRCADGRAVAAIVLARMLADHTAPEAAWDVLHAYVEAAPMIAPRRDAFVVALSSYATCYPSTRDRHAAANAVLSRVGLRRCGDW